MTDRSPVAFFEIRLRSSACSALESGTSLQTSDSGGFTCRVDMILDKLVTIS
jgi:hypothetical protein